MSYEGRLQHICENGHRFDTHDMCSMFSEGEYACPYCNASPCWSNPIDDTNGDEYGIILADDFAALIREEAFVVKCNLGHEHVIRETTYNVPCEGGPAVPRRHYWNSDTQNYVEIKR